VNGQCGGCRIPATLQGQNKSKGNKITNKPYTGGYLKPVECIIDPDIGPEMLFADNPRLRLTHDDIMSQGELVERAKEAVRNKSDNTARYEDMKYATGCRGISTPIAVLPYTDAYTFFEYPVAHCMALGLHSQIVKQMRDVLGCDEFNNACKRADKRAAYLLRPSVLKRPVKRMMPDSSTNLLSGYKVEDHQHAMESYHILVFHRCFAVETEINLFKCPTTKALQVYHLYWRFLSCAMFLFRGGDNTCVTSEDPPAKLESMNRAIIDYRRNFDKDVEVLCKLCELIFGAQGCTPNLHSLHHMIRHLIDVKGHPTFEMIVERLASNPMSTISTFVLVTVDKQKLNILRIRSDGNDEGACTWTDQVLRDISSRHTLPIKGGSITSPPGF